MANLRTIICEDCWTPTETRRANTKRCHVCRLVRDLAYLEKQKTCMLCERRFLPIAGKDPSCGHHAPAWARDEIITCTICGDERRSISGDLRVCAVCGREKEHRQTLYRGVVARQDHYRHRTGWQPGAQPPRPESPAATVPDADI